MIDIIIPCYNAHKTLGITLNSIINQSIKDIINVILVDDCSNENYNYFVETYKMYLAVTIIKDICDYDSDNNTTIQELKRIILEKINEEKELK